MTVALTGASKKLLATVGIRPNDRLRLGLDREGEHFTAYVYAVEPWTDKPQFASNAARREFVGRVPERKQLDGFEKWSFACTDFTAVLIEALWPPEQVIFDDAETKVTYDYLRLSLAAQEETLRVLAEKGDCVDVQVNEANPLAGYQRRATWAASRNEGYGLFMDPGTGKTAVGIAKVCNAAAKKTFDRMYRALIVCPKNVRSNWEAEFKKFATLPGKITVLRGWQVKRVKQLLDALTATNGEQYTAVVCSYECMVRMIDTLCAVEWDVTFLDESHFIKWPETKRCKAAMKLREKSLTRHCLTGTPVANSPLDLYSQFEFLGRGASGFMNWKNFRSFFGVFDRGEHGDKLIGLQNIPLMKERLARYAYVIKKEEALPDLPAKVYDIVEVEMTTEQRDVYDALRTNLIAEIENALDSAGNNRSVVINNSLTKLLRLAQVTSGFIGLDAELDELGGTLVPKSVSHFDPNPKLDALIELLKDKPAGSKTIVWAIWVPDIKSITARLEAEGIQHVTFYGGTSDADREAAVASFNDDPACSVFVGNPSAGGIGINLVGHDGTDECTTNCDHVIMYSQNWSQPTRIQAEDRAHRRTTRVNVRITDLVVPGSIDEQIRSRVVEKRLTAYEIADVRSIIQAVLTGVIDDE